jgi:predicted transcriptional regulator YheO
MTETIQHSLYDESHFAISLANGRQYELGSGEVIELFHAGKWQRARIEKNMWYEYCAVLPNGVAVRLTVGLTARLPAGHQGLTWMDSAR